MFKKTTLGAQRTHLLLAAPCLARNSRCAVNCPQVPATCAEVVFFPADGRRKLVSYLSKIRMRVKSCTQLSAWFSARVFLETKCKVTDRRT